MLSSSSDSVAVDEFSPSSLPAGDNPAEPLLPSNAGEEKGEPKPDVEVGLGRVPPKSALQEAQDQSICRMVCWYVGSPQNCEMLLTLKVVRASCPSLT